MEIKTIIDAQRYLYKFTPTGAQQVYSGGMALERPRAFYKLLGDPQNAYKVIHIAGTSGKGSTCSYISHLLQTQGFKVGLSVSPHLSDIRERLQVDNQLISEEDFCTYLSEIIPAIEKMKDSQFGFPTYFEIMQGLAFYTFFKKRVTYAVMETGLGGRFDPTNTVTRQDKLAVITKIGFDHKQILGKTLSKIALEKAKIIKQHNVTLAIEQKPQVEKVINQVAKEEDTSVTYLRRGEHIKNIQQTKQGITYDFSFKSLQLPNVKLSSFGLFQSENSAIALAVLAVLSKRDTFVIDESKLRSTLKNVLVAGRMEFVTYKNRTLILDGAHNPQKMQVFIKSVSTLFPKKKLTFIIAVKKSKEVSAMMKYVTPIAKKIILTSFLSDHDRKIDDTMTKEQAVRIQGYSSQSMEPQKIAQALDSLEFSDYVLTESLKEALQQAIRMDDDPIVITGSLYLISNIKEIFH